MFKLKYILGLFFLFCVFNTSAQKLIIACSDIESGEKLLAVYLIDNLNQKKYISDADGKVSIEDFSFPLKLQIKTLGYVNNTIVIQKVDVQKQKENYYYFLKLSKDVQGIGEVIITGNVEPVLKQNSIYKVKTISAQQIQAQGANTLNEILQFELNQFLSNDNILGSSANVGGISGQNVKILLNGVPLNGTEAGFLDLSQINLSNVKRIELVQGPMSVLYGSNALGGVINIITKDATKKIGLKLSAYLESFARTNTAIALQCKHKKHELILSSSQNYFRGWTPQDTLQRWSLWKPKTIYTGDVKYTFKEKKYILSLYNFYLNELITNKGEPISTPSRVYAFDEYYKTQRARSTIQLDYNFNENSQLNAQNSISLYKRYKNRFYKDLVNLTENLTSDINDQDTSTFVQLHSRFAWQNQLSKNINLVTGYEFSLEKGNGKRIKEDTQSLHELGLFSTSTWKLKSLDFMPSIRYNINSVFSNNISYGMHAKWNIDSSSFFRFSLAKGYRSPGLKELYLVFFDNNHIILGNEDLNQEEAIHTEMNYEKSFRIDESYCSFAGQFFSNNMKNKISLQSIGQSSIGFQYMNIDRFANFGANVELKYRLAQTNATMAFAYTNIVHSTSFPTGSFYEVILNANYLIKYFNTQFSFYYRYIDRQPLYYVDGRFAWSPPLHLSNISLSKSVLNQKLKLQIGIKNWFNTSYNAVSIQSGGAISPHGGDNSSLSFLPRSFYINIIYDI